MGEYRPDPTRYPSMWNFKPDDTDDEFYIEGSATIDEIMTRVFDKWGADGYDDIRITPERIHTRCIYYDLYDASDYDDFLKIERINNG